ncbi:MULTISPECIES: methyltransferase [Actinokineospora]|uniref:Methyltransferase n=1 Tax=Actinokineospora fastidiosa TaxID=1816 RepID=A0A918GS92_9PSEU|nr:MULTISPECIES: methyltransferase [Actinokineospora]UVS81487.1 Carminomycin 4-O-methyltransferase [Actinokineospora sp. UTMC 2448]GGS57754.1 methyltransferase [Actinokineospora fastidiosa]
MFGDLDGNAKKLWSMAGLGTPMAIRVAATLRVADHIVAGKQTAAELAEACGAHADTLERLLRYLSVRGVFARDDEGRYSLTPLGQPLREDHPAKARAWFDIDGMGWGELSFVELLHSVRTGEAAFPKRYGREYWDDMRASKVRTESFHALHGADVAARAPGIVAGFDWASLGKVTDVGGGDGSLLTAILKANPGLRGAVFDMPDATPAAKQTFVEAGIDDRAEAISGSFFETIPSGSDAYMLSIVLHDWPDEDAVKILRNCAAAAGPDGRVLIIETIGDGEETHTGMDLRMLALYAARERGVADFSELARQAGLRTVDVHRAGPSAIIELRAA